MLSRLLLNEIRRLFGALFGLALFCGSCGSSPPAWAAEDPHAQQIGAILAPLVSRHEPGLAVLVRLNGKTVFKRGYGSRDLRSGAPINARSNFRLASCTKQFTAIAVLLLVHDGKLRLVFVSRRRARQVRIWLVS